MAGRRPKPTALKELNGNPGHRPLNKLEPKPEAGAPEMPDDLSPAAKKEWNSIVPILLSMNVLTIADGKALGGYCEAFALARQAKREIKKFGITILTMAGRKKNPAVGVYVEAEKLMRAFLSDFGMSPATRSRLTTTAPKEDEDPMRVFLKRAQRLDVKKEPVN